VHLATEFHRTAIQLCVECARRIERSRVNDSSCQAACHSRRGGGCMRRCRWPR
jgi:hypothetical protein